MSLKNINASPRLTKHLVASRAFAEQPLVVVDIGARRGFEPHWSVYGDQVKLIGFEADAEECERLKDEPYNLGLDEANYTKEELANLVKRSVPSFNIVFSDIGTDPDQRNYIVSNAKLREHGFTAHRTVQQGINELIKAYQMLPASGLFQNA